MPVAAAPANGVIKQRSDYGFDETIVRIKADIATKGIRFFDEIDQTKLGESAKLPIKRSTLLLSAIRRSASNSSSRTPSPVSTGLCACPSHKMMTGLFG